MNHLDLTYVAGGLGVALLIAAAVLVWALLRLRSLRREEEQRRRRRGPPNDDWPQWQWPDEPVG